MPTLTGQELDGGYAAGLPRRVNQNTARGLKTRLKIPLLYGVDSVHGHGNLLGSTVFPHNIGLGATRDPDLVRQIAKITGEETLATLDEAAVESERAIAAMMGLR